MEAGDLLCGRYRVVRRIARGGMGEVFQAHDEVLEQAVALKCVDFSGLPADEAEQARARTLREARLAARLRGSPHVVSVYDVVEPDGTGEVWLVLEYVPAHSLAEMLDEKGRLDPVDVARIGAAVAAGLELAHRHDVLHRDVKPGNVLVRDSGGGPGTVPGDVKLTDFGISRAAGDPSGRLTATDVVSGTPAYMSREVARGDDPTPASDLWALGATLYRAVEGHPPFGVDGNALRLMYRIASEPVPRPEHAGALEPLLLRLLASDPATRPDAALARELLDDFARRPDEPTVATGPAAGTNPPAAGTIPPVADAPATPTTAAATLTGPAAPVDSPPGAGVPTPGSAEVSWWRRHRRLLVAGAAVLVVAIVGVLGVVVLGPRSTPADPLAMPSSVGPVSLTVPPAEADPCPLLDVASLGAFGRVGIDAGNRPAGCRARIGGPGGNAVLDVSFGPPTALLPVGTTGVTPVGAIGIARGRERTLPGRGQLCPRTVVLSDATRVDVDVSVYGLAAQPCAITDVATAGAVRALAEHGVTADPERPARYSFARTDACGLLTLDDLTRVAPGVATSSPSPGFAHWSCGWGPGPQVSVMFVTDNAALANYGTPTQVGGRRAFVLPDESGCSAWVVHRNGSADGSVVAELLSTRVGVPGRPAADQCADALSLADVAQGRTP